MSDAKKNQKWISVIGMKKLFSKNILKLKTKTNKKPSKNPKTSIKGFLSTRFQLHVLNTGLQIQFLFLSSCSLQFSPSLSSYIVFSPLFPEAGDTHCSSTASSCQPPPHPRINYLIKTHPQTLLGILQRSLAVSARFNLICSSNRHRLLGSTSVLQHLWSTR